MTLLLIKSYKKGFCVYRGIANGEKRHVKMNRNTDLLVVHGTSFSCGISQNDFWNTTISSQKCWVTVHAVNIDFPDVDISPNRSSCAQCTSQTNQNISVWSRERFIAGPCKETGGSWPPDPRLSECFQQNIFKGQAREEGHRVCDQLMHNCLIGWW